MVVPQRVVGVSARRIKVAVGVGLGIIVVAAAVAALLLRDNGQQTDTGVATRTLPERTNDKPPVRATIEAEATPLQKVRLAADRLARTNHGWLVTHPSDRKSGNTRLDTMGNVDGATDGTITHFKLSFGFGEMNVAYTSNKVAVFDKGKWQVIADEGDKNVAGLRVQKSAGALAQYIAAGLNSAEREQDAIVGQVNPDTATKLLAEYQLGQDARRSVEGVKGGARFWIEGDDVTKFDFEVSGKLIDPAKGTAKQVTNSGVYQVKDIGQGKVSLPAHVKTRLLDSETRMWSGTP